MTAVLAMQVWVGCMNHYAAGRLTGQWVDAADATAWRCPIGGSSPYVASGQDWPDAARWTPGTGWTGDPAESGCEEYWVLDTDEMPVDREMSPAEAVRWAQVLATVEPYEQQAFADFVGYHGMDAAAAGKAVEDFRDAACGQHDSIEDFAWQQAEELYEEFLRSCPPGFRIEICVPDWEADHWISSNGHVFRDC